MRFAEYNPATGEYVFSNVRNGLIVGLVWLIPCAMFILSILMQISFPSEL